MDNVHPGDILREDFLIGGEIASEDVAQGAGIDIARLTRYLGMSEGFFLRLQNSYDNSYDLEEVRCRDAAALDRIVPRAA